MSKIEGERRSTVPKGVGDLCFHTYEKFTLPPSPSAESGRNRQNLAEFGSNWQELAEFGRIFRIC